MVKGSKQMKPVIITLSGVAHSGKDTTADYLVNKLNKLGINSIKLGLANQLKIISQKLIQLFYGVDIPIDEFHNMEKKELIRPELPIFDGNPFKLRTVLQKIGTEVFRDSLWNSIWCDYISHNLKEKFSEYQVIIISDCRFPDEINYFKNLESSGQISSFISFKITRPTPKENSMSEENKAHASEAHISTMKVDYNIINDASLKCLYRYLDRITIPIIRSQMVVRESKKLKTTWEVPEWLSMTR